jgi:biopolymer transport protein ExbD
MANTQAFYDVWLMGQNLVYKEVPFHVITDWIQQSRLTPEDQLKPTGTPNWGKIKDSPLFMAYVSRPQPAAVEEHVVTEPIDLDFDYKRKHEDEDDDVDMIPLIDISLVLLIFFMMTASVATISKILVPDVYNGAKPESGDDNLTIEIDLNNGDPIYGLAIGKTNASGELANLSEEGLFQQIDERIKNVTKLVNISIAAHKDLTYEQVERVMKAIDSRKEKGALIGTYNIQVGERAKQ